MTDERMVMCKKLGKEGPGLPFKPFTDDFGQLVYEQVSLEAWRMWLNDSPRYINTQGVDLQSKEGQEFVRKQMRIYFGFDEGENIQTAWRPPEE